MKNKLRFWFAGISLLIFVLDILIIVNNSGSTYAAATIKKTYCCAASGLSCISDNSKSCGFCSSGWKLCSPTLPKKYSVTFNMNGGSYEESSTKKINYSSTYSFSGKPSWNNRVFIGWSKNDSSCSCDKKFNEGTVSGGSGDNGSVYYACWRDAYCWGCNKDGDYIGFRVSYDSPIISGISCQNDKWKTPGSNPYGTGTWTKVSYSVYCNACDGPTPPPPNNTETEACYKCSSNGEYKYGLLSEIDDSFCEGTIEKQEGVSKNECKESTITEKHCTVDKPSGDKLSCNSSKTLESTCDNRTIIIDDLGYADVKIEQKGYVSSVLTPDRIHQGGGFSFGVVYTNTVKWSYINNSVTGELHNEITKKMNDKIMDYNSYIESLKLSEISFGGKIIDNGFMVKKCSTSSENKDYYNKELTVTCVFYLPDSVLDKEGEVNYAESGTSVDNKYFVPLDFKGKYNIDAKIQGMSRITEKSSKADGKDGKSWTGNWDDYGKINDCNIDVYSLFYKEDTDEKTVYNFIYRPIDINKPFPNRNAGINWYDWYSKNKEKLESTYENKQYEIELDNNKISEIKTYNKDKNYLDWDTIDDNGKSSFVNEYVVRVGGNS